MGFWNQVIKGKRRKTISIDVLGHTIDSSYLDSLLEPLYNSTLLYGGDFVQIYKKEKNPMILFFTEYGPHNEVRYRDVFENIVFSLEISPHGETALFSAMDYQSEQIIVAAKLHLA